MKGSIQLPVYKRQGIALLLNQPWEPSDNLVNKFDFYSLFHISMFKMLFLNSKVSYYSN